VHNPTPDCRNFDALWLADAERQGSDAGMPEEKGLS
jgi:hypothetical protein